MDLFHIYFGQICEVKNILVQLKFLILVFSKKPCKPFAKFSIYEQIFETELEMDESFGGFNDVLHSFVLLRGKSNGDDDDDPNRIFGKFKV